MNQQPYDLFDIDKGTDKIFFIGTSFLLKGLLGGFDCSRDQTNGKLYLDIDPGIECYTVSSRAAAAATCTVPCICVCLVSHAHATPRGCVQSGRARQHPHQGNTLTGYHYLLTCQGFPLPFAATVCGGNITSGRWWLGRDGVLHHRDRH